MKIKARFLVLIVMMFGILSACSVQEMSSIFKGKSTNTAAADEDISKGDVEKAFKTYFTAAKDKDYNSMAALYSENELKMMDFTKDDFIKAQQEMVFTNGIVFSDYLISSIEDTKKGIKKINFISNGTMNGKNFANRSTIYYLLENGHWKFSQQGVLSIKSYSFPLEKDGYYKFDHLKQVSTVDGIGFIADITNNNSSPLNAGQAKPGKVTVKTTKGEEEVTINLHLNPKQTASHYFIKTALKEGDLQSITFNDVYFTEKKTPDKFTLNLTKPGIE